MAISKITVNGTTNMDVTATTATADKILAGYGCVGADGVWVDGEYAGTTIPTFTITIDSSFQIASVTCDMTYAQCAELLDDGELYASVVVSLPDSSTQKLGASGFADMSSLYYVALEATNLEPMFEIEYDNRGNIDAWMPPRYIQTLSVTQNGTYYGLYNEVDVSVPSSAPSLQSKTATPSTSQQTITADSGYDGLSSVQINAMPSGTATAPTSISGTSATVSTGTNTLTLSKTVSVTPRITTAGYVSSGTAGNSSVSLTANVTTQAAQTIYPSTSDQSIAASCYLTGAQTIKGVAVANLTAANVKQGVTVTVGDSADADRIMSVTGTYSGGGSSMNVQVAQSTSRATSTAYTELVTLTCSVAGTYDVYWSTFRTSTSGTWGSQLYINDDAYGSAQTTFTNHIQNVHLTGVSLAKNDEVAVRARSRGNSYYGYVGTLTIKQTA